MAALSPLFGADVYRAGIGLSIVLSSLFIVPLGLYGLAIGYPAAGVLGGLVGTFSYAYMWRSSILTIDTDGGNLFFVWLLAWTIVSVRAGASFRRSLIFTLLAGLGLAAFCRWYAQPGFWLIYLLTFALHVSFAGFSRSRALQLVLLFALCSNPLNAGGAVSCDAVSQAIFHALTSKRPRTRYLVGRDARLYGRLAQVCPDHVVDWDSLSVRCRGGVRFSRTGGDQSN